MKKIITDFQNKLKKGEIYCIYKDFNPIIHKFKCYLITEENYQNNSEIQNIKNEPDIIIIDKIGETDDMYFIVIFDEVIIFIPESDISIITNIVKITDEINIFTISEDINLPHDIQQKIYKYNKHDNKIYLETISEFASKLYLTIKNSQSVRKLWGKIKKCFCSYFINKSYKELRKERITIYDKNDDIKIELNDNNHIRLQSIGNGYSSVIYLIYHIEKGKLFALKQFIKGNAQKSFDREYNFYKNAVHPFIPHFYGEITIDGYRSLIIEYIRGINLEQIHEIKLSEQEKNKIFFQLMTLIEFFQFHNYIHRDLKPSNLMIDENKNLVVIDFDQMINTKERNTDEQITKDFNTCFTCPELQIDGIIEYSFKEDVYSIGPLIYFIIFGEEPEQNEKLQFLFEKFESNQQIIKQICEETTQIDHKNRPTITKLIDYFYNNLIYANNQNLQLNSNFIVNNINKDIFYPQWMNANEFFKSFFPKDIEKTHKNLNKNIEFHWHKINIIHLFYQFELGLKFYPENYFTPNISNFIDCFTILNERNNCKSQYYLGKIYYKGKYIQQNINKSIHYLTLAANQNHLKAQFYLGFIYYEGKYITRDINKSIYYLTLAANQNDLYAQFYLGIIYYLGKYITRDINKSIHYFTLAANQNYPDAQFYLGIIYYEDKYITRDINKSIHYFTLAANQNDPDAQYYLGLIYYEGKYITRDINKSIYYFTLAANQNYPDAQLSLGIIYYEGKYITRDINKSIHYYTLAANQNDPDAQFYLGLIYYLGKYITRDINKSIHYFTLAANQNDLYAQFYLGIIYYEDKYITRDINKSIHYLTLAANQKHPAVQFCLGLIYYEGKYITRDINKSIHYFAFAANQNHPAAQFYLGLLYIRHFYNEKNMIKAIDYFIQSASNGNIDGHFIVGYFYHEGKYVEKDIRKSIYHYKEASSFNNQYAKNNLGIIYRYGCGDDVKPNYGFSVEYFEEAVKRFKDKVSMYNLSHIYIYIFQNKEMLEKSIKLLIESYKLDFSPSINLLCIALIKLFGFKSDIIFQELTKITENSTKISNLVYNIILDNNLLDEPNFNNYYQLYSTIDYYYDYDEEIIITKSLNEQKPKSPNNSTGKDINNEFYEGFGHDI